MYTLNKGVGKMFIHDHVYGWTKSIPKANEKILKLSFFKTAAPLPVKADILASAPAIWDQGQLGSCTAHGTGRSFAHIVFQETGAQFMPARLALYYLTRAMEGTIRQDAGGSVADSVKATVKYGVAPEALWPYDISKFTVAPPRAVMAAAEKYQSLNCYRIADNDPNKVELIKQAIVDGHCPIFGIPIYPSFEKAANTGVYAGVIPMPNKRELAKGPLGGHCLAIEGFDSSLKFAKYAAKGYMLVPNSWTTSWGKKGYALIPDDYMFHYASDIWVISSTEIGL